MNLLWQLFWLIAIFLKLCNNHQRYMEFIGDSAHPRILTEKDESTLTNGSFQFARKFDQDSKILDVLDEYIFYTSRN